MVAVHVEMVVRIAGVRELRRSERATPIREVLRAATVAEVTGDGAGPGSGLTRNGLLELVLLSWLGVRPRAFVDGCPPSPCERQVDAEDA